MVEVVTRNQNHVTQQLLLHASSTKFHQNPRNTSGAETDWRELQLAVVSRWTRMPMYIYTTRKHYFNYLQMCQLKAHNISDTCMCVKRN